MHPNPKLCTYKSINIYSDNFKYNFQQTHLCRGGGGSLIVARITSWQSVSECKATVVEVFHMNDCIREACGALIILMSLMVSEVWKSSKFL